jgi:tetratricopeptide (TPR) repeat protein
MKSRIAILFIWIFSFGNFFAQDKNIDSLKLALKKIPDLNATAPDDTLALFLLNSLIEVSPDGEWETYNDQMYELANAKSKTAKKNVKAVKRYLGSAFNNWGFAFIGKDKVKALENYDKALEIYKSVDNKAGIAVVLTNMAAVYKTTGDAAKALEYNMAAITACKKAGDEKTLAKTLNNVALIYHSQGNVAAALDYLFKSLTIREKLQDTLAISSVYLNLGLMYTAQNKKDKSLEYYFKALKIRQQRKDENGEGTVLNNIAQLYTLHKMYDSALFYIDRSLLIKRKLNEKQGIVQALNSLGHIYMELKQPQKALAYYEEALKLALQRNDKQSIATLYSSIGSIYFRQGNINKAEEYGKISLKSAQEMGYPKNLYLSSNLLYLIYKQKSKHKDALLMHELSVKMNDSINDLEARKADIQKQFQYEYEKKSSADSLKTAEEKKVTAAQFKQEKTQRYALYGGLALVALFAVFMFNRFRVTNRQKQIIEIKEQETQHQKKVVEEKNKEITDSITYAKRIQEAILPPQDFVNEFLPDNFILYKPKDLVAGDFYWMEVMGDKIFIAAADSTGHGVPGALVSVVCSNALNRALKEFSLLETGKILDKTRDLVLETFAKSNEQVKDGMDISLLCIDKKNNTAFWSGANNPLWKISENNLQEIKADKQPIGKTDHPKPFTTHSMPISQGDIFFLFTDGFADQFGGEKGKKFKYQQLKDLLVSINNIMLNKQEALLSKAFDDWKGKLEQVDDVCIIGIKI